MLDFLHRTNPQHIVDEWNNFLERMNCNSEEELRMLDELEEELRLWASYRGQTLTKTGKRFFFLSVFGLLVSSSSECGEVGLISHLRSCMYIFPLDFTQ